MSDNEKTWPEVYDPNMVKCLTLSSGEKIITYVRDITQLGSFLCERPFTVNISLEDGSFCLLQYQPYGRSDTVHIFQQHGVIGMVDASEYGRKQYLDAVKAEVDHDAKFQRNGEEPDVEQTLRALQQQLKDALGDSQELDDLFGGLDLEENISKEPQEKNVIDLSKWKVDDDTSKN